MKTVSRLLPFCLLSGFAIAQSVAIFPDEYIDVAEGPLNSPNLPLGNGISRVQVVYDAIDLAIPSGHQITKLGFRQDGTVSTLDTGRITNLEVRMGWTTAAPAAIGNNFDANYAAPPVTVFGPSNYTLPNLRDSANPLVDGKFWIPLAVPFAYVPAGQNLIVEYRCFGNSGGGGAWNFRLDRADYYSPIAYGPDGCAHSGGGIPNLTVQPTRPGLSYSCTVTNAPANTNTALLVQPNLQLLAAPFSLEPFFGTDPSCTCQVFPIGGGWLSALTSGSGTATMSLSLPNDPSLADLYISSQAGFLDLFAPGGLVFSRGCEVLTGSRPRTAVVSAAGPPATVTTGSITQFYCPVVLFEHQ